MRRITLTLNGTFIKREVEDSRLLVEFLREDLKLTGTKESCGVGVCGACTVLLDGKPISSCLALAVHADGCAVTTIEGVAEGDRLHPLQEAFLAHGGIQMRHLHTRADPRGQSAARRQSTPHAVGDPSLDDGQSLPLHRLLQDHRIDCGRYRGRMT
jgi:hypothetical protein